MRNDYAEKSKACSELSLFSLSMPSSMTLKSWLDFPTKYTRFPIEGMANDICDFLKGNC